MIPINFVGKLGANCEVVALGQNNSKAIKFNVAVTVRQGREKSTVWMSCIWFGKVAESNYIDYLNKGTEVFVSGVLSSTNVGSTGVAYLNVNVTNATLTNGTKQQAAQQNNNQNQNQQNNQNQQGYSGGQQQNTGYQRTVPQQNNSAASTLDDDLPF